MTTAIKPAFRCCAHCHNCGAGHPLPCNSCPTQLAGGQQQHWQGHLSTKPEEA